VIWDTVIRPGGELELTNFTLLLIASLIINDNNSKELLGNLLVEEYIMTFCQQRLPNIKEMDKDMFK